MSKKDKIRNYAIWGMMILFYILFYFINHHGWLDHQPIDTSPASLTSNAPTTSLPVKGNNLATEDGALSQNASNIVPPRDTTKAPVLSESPKRTESRKNSKPFVRRYRQQTHVDINQATVIEWQNLYNIGPYRAEKIVNFRNALGGFYSIDQVGETYALPDSVFRDIAPFLTLDSSWSLLPVNNMPYDSLYLHPYITKQMAYFIVRHRERHGPIADTDILYNILDVKDHERLKKLEPYLDFGI